MKTFKFVVVLVILAALGFGNAWARRGHDGHGGRHHPGHAHFGVVIGPSWGPWYYPPPPYYFPHYYPPVVIEAPEPDVYIEQLQAPATDPVAPAESAAAAPAHFWYYCEDAKGYYPYVKECPDGWQKVLPHPPRQP